MASVTTHSIMQHLILLPGSSQEVHCTLLLHSLISLMVFVAPARSLSIWIWCLPCGTRACIVRSYAQSLCWSMQISFSVHVLWMVSYFDILRLDSDVCISGGSTLVLSLRHPAPDFLRSSTPLESWNTFTTTTIFWLLVRRDFQMFLRYTTRRETPQCAHYTPAWLAGVWVATSPARM
jgi:hypothetical protein